MAGRKVVDCFVGSHSLCQFLNSKDLENKVQPLSEGGCHIPTNMQCKYFHKLCPKRLWSFIRGALPWKENMLGIWDYSMLALN